MDKLNRRRFLAFAAALSAVPAAQAAQSRFNLDLMPQPDADDGLTFRVLAIHDIRDNLHADIGSVADTCATKAVSAEGKPLSGAAKTSFMKKCEKGA